MSRMILGVDEAGRGPLAGPVAVGVVAVPHGFNVIGAFPGLGDSKLISEEKREELYRKLLVLMRDGVLSFSVQFSAAKLIDEMGMTKAVADAVARGVRALAPDARDARILLDGLLKAPEEYRQQTIIHGDEQVPVIALASVAAKVRRDRLMRRLAKQFPEYGFEIHKGYGTPAHRQVLQKLGPCAIHRRLFCRKFIDAV